MDALRRRLVIALGLSVVCSLPIGADYKQAYYQGYQLARQNRDWHMVAEKMQEALKENDSEGEPIVLGSANTQPYLPYFYLGLARYHLGDCRGARENWIKTSKQRKVVLHGRERDWFNSYAPICELVVPIEDSLNLSQKNLKDIGDLANDADLGKVWPQEQTLGPAHDTLRKQLDRLRSDLQQARGSRLETQQAFLIDIKDAAFNLTHQIDTLSRKARTRRDDLVAERKAREKPPAPAPETQVAADIPGPKRGLDPVEKPPPKPTPEPVSDEPVTAVAPEWLRRSFELYARGQYRLSHQVLRDSMDTVPAQWRGHAAMLRAASAFALFHAGGKKEPQLYDDAASAVVVCAEANKELRPSPRLFAPPFVEFFDKTIRSRQTARAQPP